MRYTRKIHIQRLKKMLNRENPCCCCPACEKFNIWNGFIKSAHSPDPCKICQEFLKLRYRDLYHHGKICPCDRLGHKRALERTLLALEKEESC